jgi:hypothetical protein
MKAASISELKQELAHLNTSQLSELCLKLARFKKENKELLTYLLFEAHDTDGYIQSVKKEMEGWFESINQSNLYIIKKSLRKILRLTNKYIRYSGNTTVAVELLIHFCKQIQALGIQLSSYTVLYNLYHGQVKKINQLLDELHEDLRYDYEKEVEEL